MKKIFSISLVIAAIVVAFIATAGAKTTHTVYLPTVRASPKQLCKEGKHILTCAAIAERTSGITVYVYQTANSGAEIGNVAHITARVGGVSLPCKSYTPVAYCYFDSPLTQIEQITITVENSENVAFVWRNGRWD